MIRYFHAAILVIFSVFINAQNPVNITIPSATVPPIPILSVDTYTRATTNINLLPGFKYGFLTTPVASNLMNLSIGTYPTFVSSNYIDTLPSNNPISFNPGAELGVLEGASNVTPMGAFTYELPIFCSPGTAGMQPNIAIEYNSNSGNGILGLGFYLSGISSISRSNKSVFYDQQNEGIKFNYSDIFSIDGSRLLLSSGTYGQNNASYITETESYQVINSHNSIGNGPAYFTVFTTDGKIIEYGNSNDSRLIGIGGTEVLTWYINKITDEFGNYMEYSYQNSNGEINIDKIKYTLNQNTTSIPYNILSFNYILRSDPKSSYVNGIEFKQTKALESISSIDINNATVKKYLLDYIYCNASQLTKITEVDANAAALNPTYFDWTKGMIIASSLPTGFILPPLPGFTVAQGIGASNNTSSNILSIAADLNGDGRKDLATLSCSQVDINTALPTTLDVYLSYVNSPSYIPHNGLQKITNTAQFNTQEFSNMIMEIIATNVVDEDDDGIEEIFITSRGLGQTSFIIQKIKSDGTNITISTEQQPKQIIANNFLTFWHNSGTMYQKMEINKISRAPYLYTKADFDGDNINDIINVDQDWINIGTTYQFQVANIIKAKLGDFNGDGRADLFVMTAANPYPLCQPGNFNESQYVVSVYSYTTINNVNQVNIIATKVISPNVLTSFSGCNSTSIIQFFETGSNTIDFGDFNGDGKTDIFYNHFNSQNVNGANPGSAVLNVCLSNGLNFLSEKQLLNIPTQINGFNAAFFASDLNNDGLVDWGATAYDNSNSKSLFTYYPSNGSVIAGAATQYERLTKFAGTLGDFDGDGTLDYIGQYQVASPLSIQYNVFNHNNKRMVNHVYNIKNDLKIDYSMLLDQKADNGYNLYRKTNPVNTPPINISRMPIFVAVGTNQNGNLNQYQYENSLYHRLGRGFLGFEKFYTINAFSNLMSVSSYTYDNQKDYLTSTDQTSGVAITTPNVFKTINPSFVTASSRTDYNYVITGYGSTRYLSSTFTNSKDYLSVINSNKSITYDNNKRGRISDISEYFSIWNSSAVYAGTETSNQSIVTYVNPLNGYAYYKCDKLSVIKKGTVNNALVTTTYDTDFNYDQQNFHLLSKIENSNHSTDAITTTYNNYNLFGTATQIIMSASGSSPARTNSFVYDNTGRFITKLTNAVGNFEEYQYEPQFGNVVLKKDISGLITTNNYDGQGRLIKTTLPTTAINTIDYAWYGYTSPLNPNQTLYSAMVTAKEEGNPTVVKKYDVNDNLFETTIDVFNGGLQKVQSTYNVINQITSQSELATVNPTSGAKTKTYQYDAFLRPLLINQSVNSTILSSVSYLYNAIAGSSPIQAFVTIKAPTTNTGEFTFVRREANSAGQLTKITNYSSTGTIANQHTSSYLYNQYNQPYQITNTYPNVSTNLVTTIGYDIMGRQISITDPTAGNTSYTYTDFGEIANQSSPNINENYTYDQLGRMTQNFNSQGFFYYQYATVANGKQKLEKISGPQVVTDLQYDTFGNLTENKQTLLSDNKIIKTDYTYDKYGHVINYTYPGGFTTTNEYDNIGTLIKIKNNNLAIWELSSMYTPELISQYKYGNGGMTNNITYDANQNIQQLDYNTQLVLNYQFNAQNNNLLTRNITSPASQNDIFAYDDFDRLKQVNYNDPTNTLMSRASLTYKDNGNINTKSDAGTYVYGNTSSPYQLTQITNPVGNISLNNLTISYNGFNKVNQIVEAAPGNNKQFDFTYGNDKERVKMVYSINNITSYTRYYGDNYDRQENGSTYKEWSYIYAPTGLAAIYYNNNGTGQLLYVATDHLGSPLALFDATHQIVEQYSFDAWGRRRNPVDWNDYNVSQPQYMIRGFTMHEMLDEVSIINMNGRIYDPVLGRFLQTDNFVQEPDNLQNYNRYAYCVNNPLKYKDPTGQFFGIDDAIVFGVGFVAGWVGYGLSTGHWWDNGKALAAAALVGTFAEVGYLTLGGGLAVAGSLETQALAGTGFAVEFAVGYSTSVFENHEQIATARNEGKSWNGVLLIAGYGAVASIGAGLGMNEDIKGSFDFIKPGLDGSNIWSNTATSGLNSLLEKGYDTKTKTWSLSSDDIGSSIVSTATGWVTSVNGELAGRLYTKESKLNISSRVFKYTRGLIKAYTSDITSDLFSLAYDFDGDYNQAFRNLYTTTPLQGLGLGFKDDVKLKLKIKRSLLSIFK